MNEIASNVDEAKTIAPTFYVVKAYQVRFSFVETKPTPIAISLTPKSNFSIHVNRGRPS